MPQPLLIFDLDGTLAETAGDLIAALNHVMALEGAPLVEVGQARFMLGAGGRALIQRGLAAAGMTVTPARLEVLFAAFLRHYNANIAVHTHLYAGVPAALDRFEAAGWRFAVCTNKMEHSSVTLLRTLGAEKRFAAICGQDTFAVCKPHPDALRQTIVKAGGTLSHAVMVGDSETDIRTAQAAGVPCVAVDFGYTDKHVSTFGPDRVISHFDELWGAVAGLHSLDLEPRAP
jgi:phosphoglycolate phosphatase